ncbi:MAG: TonB-dependent receptor plug domain-containing protein [Bacteroidales bacterium]|nr:TonB-dependent receptor plug domain-containing protein [Bacteroidales bacterium]MCL2132944.1 TonB-dependent receptor plug domain-containing protein [Bacteroidales bacterium]
MKLTKDACLSAFIEQIKIFPQEKIFLHTDRIAYTAGDTVWIKAYLVDAVALMPSVHSRFVYVDLINSEGNIIEKVKIRAALNQSYGQISLPQDLPEGNYSLRAYTTAMYGLSHDFFFKKDIFIASPTKAKNKPRNTSPKPTLQRNNEVLEILSAAWKNDTVSLTFNGNDTQPYYLLVHARGIVQYFEKWNRNVKTLFFPKQNFPSGILQFMLLDENYHPVTQKMLLCSNDDQANLSYSVENKDDSMKIKFVLTDNHKKNISGNFSVSITNDLLTTIDTTRNIRNYLLFHSDLKDNAKNIDSNFVTNETWKRYNIPQIISGKSDTLPGFIELGQVVSGKVTNLWGKKAIPDAQVSILSLQTKYATATTTDKNGIFSFSEMDFPDQTEFVVQAYGNKMTNRVLLSIDEEENFPAVDAVDLPVQIDTAIIEDIKQYNEEYGINATLLREVIIKAQKNEKAKPVDPFSLLATNSFDSKKINELNASKILDVLRYVAGVQVKEKSIIIRGSSSIAAIAVDGIIIESIDDKDSFGILEGNLDILDRINIADVERVDVFKGGDAAIWGSRGGGGVISITTKRGNFDYSKIEEVRYNTKKIKPLGYILPVKFNPPDQNPLIYWNPNVNTNETGETSIEFSLPKTKGGYFILIQGITNDGQIIHTAKEISF